MWKQTKSACISFSAFPHVGTAVKLRPGNKSNTHPTNTFSSANGIRELIAAPRIQTLSIFEMRNLGLYFPGQAFSKSDPGQERWHCLESYQNSEWAQQSVLYSAVVCNPVTADDISTHRVGALRGGSGG